MTVGLWFDWTGAGFGTGANDDCTALLMSYQGQRGGSPELTGAAQAGSATFTLLNPDGLFDPDNASSPLYGLLRDGVRVWLGANEDGSISGAGTVRGRFAGRITDISPLPMAGAGTSTPTVEIVCEDALGWYGRTPVRLSVAAVTTDYIPPLPVRTPALLQQASASGATTVSLGAGATAGSLLLAAVFRQSASPVISTPGWTKIGSDVIAHPSYGGCAALWYKVAAGGETTITVGSGGGLVIAELSGPFGGGYLPGGESHSSYNAGTAVSQASGAPGAQSLVAGAVATRLRSNFGVVDGILTPSAGTSIAPPVATGPAEDGSGGGSCVLLWGVDSAGTGATLAGTQSGRTQDGYYWGMQIGAWGL